MDTQVMCEVLDSIQDGAQEAYSAITSTITNLRNHIDERVLAQISRKPHNNLVNSATASPEFSHEAMPHINDVDKAVARALHTISLPYSNNALLQGTTDSHDLIKKYFSQAPDTLSNKPPAVPSYADILASQTLLSGQPYAYDTPSFVAFLVQDNVDAYVQLKYVERSLLFKSLVSNRFADPCDIRRASLLQSEITRHKQAALDLLVRLLSLSVHSQIVLPDELINRTISCFQDPDINFEKRGTILTRLKAEEDILAFDPNTYSTENNTGASRKMVDGASTGHMGMVPALSAVFADVDHWITTEDVKASVLRHIWVLGYLEETIPQFEYSALVNQELAILDAIVEAREYADVSLCFAQNTRKYISPESGFKFSHDAISDSRVIQSTIIGDSRHYNPQMPDASSKRLINYIPLKQLYKAHNMSIPIISAIKTKANYKATHPGMLHTGALHIPSPQINSIVPPTLPMTVDDCVGALMSLGDLKTIGVNDAVDWNVFFTTKVAATSFSIDKGAPKSTIVNIDALITKILARIDSATSMQGRSSDKELVSGRLLFHSKEWFSNLFKILPQFTANSSDKSESERQKNHQETDQDNTDEQADNEGYEGTHAHKDSIFVLSNDNKNFEQLYQEMAGDDLGIYYTDPGLDYFTPCGLYTGDASSSMSGDGLNPSIHGINLKSGLYTNFLSDQEKLLYESSNPVSALSSDLVYDDILRVSPSVSAVQQFLTTKALLKPRSPIDIDQGSNVPAPLLNDKDRMEYRNLSYTWHDAVHTYKSNKENTIIAKYRTTAGTNVSICLDRLCATVLGLITNVSIHKTTNISTRLLNDEAQAGIQAYEALTDTKELDERESENSYIHKILYTSLTYLRFIFLAQTWSNMVLEMTKIHAMLANTKVLVEFLNGDFSQASDLFYASSVSREQRSNNNLGRSTESDVPGASSGAKSVLPSRPATTLGTTSGKQTPGPYMRSPTRDSYHANTMAENDAIVRRRSGEQGAGAEVPGSSAKTELDHLLNVKPFQYTSANFSRDPVMSAPSAVSNAIPDRVTVRPLVSVPGVSETACRIASQSDCTYSDLTVPDDLPRYISSMDKFWNSLVYLKKLQGLKDSVAINGSVQPPVTGTRSLALDQSAPGMAQALHQINEGILNNLFVIEEDGVYSLTRKKLVFQSAIADVSAILRDDHIAVSMYIARVFAQVKQSLLRLCFKRSGFYQFLVNEQTEKEDSAEPISLTKLGDQYIYDNLSKVDRDLVDSLSLESVVDRLGILYSVLNRELLYLRAKQKAVSCLYESLFYTYDVRKAKEIQQTMFNLAQNRPKCFLSYPSMPPFHEEMAVDLLESEVLVKAGINDMPTIDAAFLTTRLLPHPAYPLQVELSAINHLATVLSTTMEMELQHHYARVATQVDNTFISAQDLCSGYIGTNKGTGLRIFPFGHVPQSLQPGAESTFVLSSPCDKRRRHVIGAYIPSISELYKIPLLMNQASTELLSEFISETNPKLFTSLHTVLSDEQTGPLNKSYSFPIYTARLSLTCHLAVARIFSREAVRMTKLWRANGTTLPRNTKMYTNSGLLGSSRSLLHLLETAILHKKADSDKTTCNTVSSDKNIVAERLICSLIGLMVPAGGGYIGKGTLTLKEKMEKAKQLDEQQKTARRGERAGSAIRRKMRSRGPSATMSIQQQTKSVTNSKADGESRNVMMQHNIGTSTLRMTTKDDQDHSMRDEVHTPGSTVLSTINGTMSTFSTANFSIYNDSNANLKMNGSYITDDNVVELESAEFGPLAEHFARSATIKDIFIHLDRGARIQVSSLLKSANYRLWEGYPDALPLPFSILVLLLNLLWSRRLLATATVLSHALRSVELSQVEVFTGKTVPRDQIPLFPRLAFDNNHLSVTTRSTKSTSMTMSYMDFHTTRDQNPTQKRKIDIPVEGYNYKEYVSHSALLNNIPFLATIDPEAMHYLLVTNMDNPAHVLTCLLSEDFDLSYGISTKVTTVLGETLHEVLLSGNIKGVCDSPLVSEMLQGLTGIFGRIAFTEVCLNSYRSAVVRNNQFSAVFTVLSKAICGHYDAFARRIHLVNKLASMDPVETQSAYTHTYTCMRVGLFFANSVSLPNDSKDTLQFFSFSDRAVPSDLSSAYYIASEDMLTKIASLANTELRFRTKQFHNDDFNPATLFAYRQALFYTCCQALLTETKRTALEAQIKGQLSVLRTALQEVNQDNLILLLDPSPPYRGVLEQTPSMNSTEMILTAEGFLSNPFTIPHPIMFHLESNQIPLLEIILTYFTCLDSVVRYAFVKALLNSSDMYLTANTINSELAFISELQHITIQINETYNLSMPMQGNSTASGGAKQGKASASMELLTLLAPSCIHLEDKELFDMNAALTSIVKEYTNVMAAKRSGRIKPSDIAHGIEDVSSYFPQPEASTQDTEKQDLVVIDKEEVVIQSKNRLMELEISSVGRSNSDDVYMLFDTAKRNLEYCKLDIFVKKLLEMKDRVDVLVLAVVTQAASTSLHRGLGLASRSFLRMGQILAVRQNFQLGMHGINLEVHPAALYAKFQASVLQRSLRESAEASPYIPAPANQVDTVPRSITEIKMKRQCSEPYSISTRTPYAYQNVRTKVPIEPPHASIASHCNRNSSVVISFDLDKGSESHGQVNDTGIRSGEEKNAMDFMHPLQAKIKRDADQHVGSVFFSHPSFLYTRSANVALMACMSIPVTEDIPHFQSRYAITNAISRIQFYKIGISRAGTINRLPLFADPVAFQYIRASALNEEQRDQSLVIRPYIPSKIKTLSSFSYIDVYNAPYSSPSHLRSLATGSGINGSIGFYHPFGLCSDFLLFQSHRHGSRYNAATFAEHGHTNSKYDVGKNLMIHAPTNHNDQTEIFLGSLYFPHLHPNQSASLLANITSIELDALCVTEITRSFAKERESTEHDEEGASAEAVRPSSDTSSWAGKMIEMVLASRILEQDRIERLYLRLHGINDNHKHSALLSPVGIFGANQAMQMMRVPFMKKLHEIRQQEDEINRKKSVFDRTKGLSLVTLKRRDMQTFLILPLFIYMTERTTDKVTVKKDAQSFQECLLIMRSLQTEALTMNIRTIIMRQFLRRLGYLENNLAALNKYNSITDMSMDFANSTTSLGATYISFLSSSGEGVRLSQIANIINREASNAKTPFGISSLKQVPPSVITSVGIVSGIIDAASNDFVGTSGFKDSVSSHSVAVSAKLKSAKALADVLETGIAESLEASSAYKGFLNINSSYNKTRLGFDEYALMHMHLIRVISGIANFAVARIVTKLKREISSIQVRNPMSFLYTIASAYSAVHANAITYTVNMPVADDIAKGVANANSSPILKNVAILDTENFSTELLLFKVEEITAIFSSISLEVTGAMVMVKEYFNSLFSRRIDNLGFSLYKDRFRNMQALKNRYNTLQAEIVRRSMASLNPIAAACTDELGSMTTMCYQKLRSLHVQETCLRNALHAEMSRRVLFLYDSILIAKRHKYLMLSNKQGIVNRAVSDTRKKYTGLLDIIFKGGPHTQLVGGPDSARQDGAESHDALAEYDYDVLSRYDSMLRELSEEWGNLRLRLHLQRNFSNFCIVHLRSKLSQLLDSIGVELAKYSKNIWLASAREKEIELNLGSRVHNLQTIIADKMSEIAELRGQIDGLSSKRSRSATGQGKTYHQDRSTSGRPRHGSDSKANHSSAEGSNVSLYGMAAKKFLPELSKAAVKGGVKLCSEVETQLVQLKRLSVERDSLIAERKRLEQAIDQIRRQSILAENNLKRSIQKEKQTIAKAEAQCADIVSRTAAVKTSMSILQKNAMTIEEVLTEQERAKLLEDIERASIDVSDLKEQIARLSSAYPELFQQIEQ